MTQNLPYDKNNVSQLKKRRKVSCTNLKKYSNPEILPKSTEFAPTTELTLGQTRAIHAFKTAFEIKAQGYHVFAVGENGLGKRTFVTNYLNQYGCQQFPIHDWAYVYNFEEPSRPIAISLPQYTAPKIQKFLIEIWHDLEDYLKRAKNNFLNQNTSTFDNSVIDSTLQLEKYSELAADLITPKFESLKKQLSRINDKSKLFQYLAAVKRDMVKNAEIIANGADWRFEVDDLSLVPDRYYLNVLVSNQHTKFQTKDNNEQFNYSEDSNSEYNDFNHKIYSRCDLKYTNDSAPILYEPYPKLSNLLGCVCKTTKNSTTVSNHAMIQPGSLHQANGGYLIIEAGHLAEHVDAWQALKRTLQSRKIELSNYRQSDEQGGYPLNPEPIPLNLKVILLGEPDLYDQFSELDAEFHTTFKIRADFHDEVARSTENEIAMSSKMADIIHKYQLKHFDNYAQAAILEYLSLQSEDQNKLSLHTDRMIQLMLEANLHAVHQNSELVDGSHIKLALDDMCYRSGYLKELYLQEITDGQQLINTSGKAIGQINALTVVNYANSEFGMPALLTAVVQHSSGSGDILDIERDVELGGSLHAKGMLIMNSYLRALFSPYHPLNFTASLAFEQSYAHIDGDSATLAEACALLSALSDTPISQSIAITGSMNQLGRVQAVGGVNAKISGFFDACVHKGLTGSQGVIIPFANVSQLMLRDDIIDAVKAKKFHIYGVNTLSEALSILSNMPVDATTKKGHFRKSSLFGKVIKNLEKWEEQLNPPEQEFEAKTDNTTKDIKVD